MAEQSLTQQLIADHLAKRKKTTPLSLAPDSPTNFDSSGGSAIGMMQSGFGNMFGGVRASVDRDVAARNALVQSQNTARTEQAALDAKTLQQEIDASESALDRTARANEGVLNRAKRGELNALQQQTFDANEESEAKKKRYQGYVSEAASLGLDPSRVPELNTLAKKHGITTLNQPEARGQFDTFFKGSGIDRTQADLAQTDRMKQAEDYYSVKFEAPQQQALQASLGDMPLEQAVRINEAHSNENTVANSGGLAKVLKELTGIEDIDIEASDVGALASALMEEHGGKLPVGILSDALIQAKGSTGVFATFEGTALEEARKYLDSIGIGKSTKAREVAAGLKGFNTLLDQYKSHQTNFMDQVTREGDRFKTQYNTESFKYGQNLRKDAPTVMGKFGSSPEDEAIIRNSLPPSQKVEGQGTVLRPTADIASEMFNRASQPRGNTPKEVPQIQGSAPPPNLEGLSPKRKSAVIAAQKRESNKVEQAKLNLQKQRKVINDLQSKKKLTPREQKQLTFMMEKMAK